MLALNQTSPSLYSGQSSRPPRGRLGTIQQCGRLLLPTLVAALKATNIDICWTCSLCYNYALKSRAHYQISIIQVFFPLRLKLIGIRLVESAPAGLKGAESCFLARGLFHPGQDGICSASDNLIYHDWSAGPEVEIYFLP